MSPDPAPSEAELRDEAADLWTLKWSIILAAGLSTASGLAESLCLAGLASYLAGGILGDQVEVLGFEQLTEPWVILALGTVTFGLSILVTVWRERTTAMWEMERRRELIRAYAEASYPAQQQQTGATLVASMEQSITASSTINSLIGLINCVARAAILLTMAFLSSWQISLVTLASGALVVIGLRYISLRTRAMNRRIGRLTVGLGEYIGDTAGAARELHMLDRWGDVTTWIDRQLDEMVHLRLRSRFLAGFVGPIFWFGTVLVGLAVGLIASRSGNIATTDLAASGILLIRSLGAAQAAQTAYQGYHDTKPYMGRVRRAIAELAGRRRPSGVAELETTRPLSVRDLTSSYGQEEVLSGISLDLDGTGGVAIVGPSGAGKSTLLLALSALVPPDRGQVLLGGVDLSQARNATVSSRIGYLAQDPRLVRAPLRTNLTRPDLAVEDPKLLEVIEAVGLTATVAGFGDGLDTMMGRSGEGLSGGELQRLGFARLLVNQPPVWLLDEPTSALDQANARRVSTLIADAFRDHLVLLVTHRPELLAHCDRVIYMEDGRVVDDGTTGEVAARHPFVAAMMAAIVPEVPSS